MQVETITIFSAWMEVADALKDDSDRGKLYHAICRYALLGELPELDGILHAYFTLIRPSIDKSNRKKVAQKSGLQKRLQNDPLKDLQNGSLKDLQNGSLKDLQNDPLKDLQNDPLKDLQNGSLKDLHENSHKQVLFKKKEEEEKEKVYKKNKEEEDKKNLKENIITSVIIQKKPQTTRQKHPETIEDLIEIGTNGGYLVPRDVAEGYLLNRQASDWIDAARRPIKPSNVVWDLKKWFLKDLQSRPLPQASSTPSPSVPSPVRDEARSAIDAEYRWKHPEEFDDIR